MPSMMHVLEDFFTERYGVRHVVGLAIAMLLVALSEYGEQDAVLGLLVRLIEVQEPVGLAIYWCELRAALGAQAGASYAERVAGFYGRFESKDRVHVLVEYMRNAMHLQATDEAFDRFITDAVLTCAEPLSETATSSVFRYDIYSRGQFDLSEMADYIEATFHEPACVSAVAVHMRGLLADLGGAARADLNLLVRLDALVRLRQVPA